MTTVAARRALVLLALGIQGAVILLAMAGAPFELRLPFGLLYAFAVPGFAVVGLLRLTDLTTEVAVSVVASIVLCTTAAQALVWLDLYSLAATLGVLAVPTMVGLVVQMRWTGLVDPGDRRSLPWPRSHWS